MLSVFSNKGVRSVKMIGILVLACSLAGGCNGRTSEESAEVIKDQSVSQAATAVVPAEIEALMVKEFSSDGEIHVQSKGGVDPNRAAAWCRYPPVIEAFARKKPPNLLGPGYGTGQNALENGEIGRPLQNGSVCNDDGKNIVSHWKVLQNRKGAPYKIVLAVWQGDVAAGKGAYWIGSVERLEGQYPMFNGASWIGDQLILSNSIRHDVLALSKKCRPFVSDGYLGEKK